MAEFDAKITEIIRRSPTVKSFRFEIPGDIGFHPGQYLALTIRVNGEEKSKPFSLSNSPTEKGFVEFTKRLTDSDFSGALNSLQKGDYGHLRLPFGKFIFEGEYPKIALLSGGIGITPFRSICKNAVDKNLMSDIVLIYGNKKPEEIIFKEDFDDMSKSGDRFHVVYCLSESAIEGSGGFYRSGYVDEETIKKEIPDYLERVFYVCGPPGMVMCLTDILKSKLNIPNEKIKIEHFMGY